jgi:hypothetical protein
MVCIYLEIFCNTCLEAIAFELNKKLDRSILPEEIINGLSADLMTKSGHSNLSDRCYLISH